MSNILKTQEPKTCQELALPLAGTEGLTEDHGP
jgi:hypothetical protein